MKKKKQSYVAIVMSSNKKPRASRKRKFADISCCPRSAAVLNKTKSKASRPELSGNDGGINLSETRKRRKTCKSKSVQKRRTAKSKTMRTVLSSSNKANLPSKAKEPVAKGKRQKHELSQEEIEDKIEEFRLFHQKHRAERKNKLAELNRAEKRELGELKKKYKNKRQELDFELNPKINENLDRLNESAVAFEDLDDESAVAIFCRICFAFERNSLKMCAHCTVHLCETCYTECDFAGCNKVYCENCSKDCVVSVRSCGGFCDFCKACNVKYGGKNHAEFCIK